MFSFQVEQARRSAQCLRRHQRDAHDLSEDVEMMVYQRQVVRDLVDKAIKAEGYQDRLRQSEEKES